MRVYLDTNAIIAMVERTIGLSDGQRSLVLRIADGDVEAETSEFSIAEVMVKPMSDKNSELVGRYLRVFSAGSGIEVQPVSRDILLNAAKVRATTKVKLPDAIHLATAESTGCDGFVSNDNRLAKAWSKDFVLWGGL